MKEEERPQLNKEKNSYSDSELSISIIQKLQEIIDSPIENGYWVKGELRKLLKEIKL